MDLFKNAALLLCILSMSACAGVRPQNGKLHPKYSEYTTLPIETKIAELHYQEPLSVKIPVTNIQAVGGGLIGALAVTAINVASTSVSYATRAEEKKAILDSIQNVSMYKNPAKTYKKTIGSADWLDIQGYQAFDEVEYRDQKVTQGIRNDMEGKAYATFGSSFQIGEEFENLTQYFTMKVYTVKNGRNDQEVYSIVLSDAFYPEESMDEGFENHTLWIENDNALIKKAITETTKNINTNLQAYIADPYMKIEEEQTKEETTE